MPYRTEPRTEHGRCLPLFIKLGNIPHRTVLLATILLMPLASNPSFPVLTLGFPKKCQPSLKL